MNLDLKIRVQSIRLLVLSKINKTSGVAEIKRPVEGMILQQDDCQVLEQKIWCIIEFFHIGTP